MNTTTTVASAHPSMSTKFIEIHGLEQTFRTAKGLFPALRDIHPVSYTHLTLPTIYSV